MTNPSDWNELSHEQKMDLFLQLNDEEIIQRYLPAGMSRDKFRRHLFQARRFWAPDNILASKKGGEPPTKETAIGAWRDLSRAEAILELIDNSVDAWMRRRDRYPSETAEKLMVFIDVRQGILTYEDNAGGVEEDNLINLIVPGYSETSYADHTIGSYQTGGKKAIFKLASEANIKTRYWNPVGTGDEAYEIHLDRKWLTDPTEYKFPYYSLKDKTRLQKGQTVYVFRLHEASADWGVDVIEQITTEIRRNYTLLLLRNPEIEIYFMDRRKPLDPYEDMYKFTGAYNEEKGLDLRPQRVQFKTKVECYGQEHDVIIEVVLGCRTTTGAPKGEDSFGIDLYGNNRLFAHREYELFREWYDFPKSAAKNFVRGYVNVIGPNILIPWDTHKRHLNPEREVIQVLRNHPVIKQLFRQWRDAYQALARSTAIKRTISKPLSWSKKGNDLYVPFSRVVSIRAKRRRGPRLPEKVHKPTVPPSKPAVKPVEIKLRFSQVEFTGLCKEYDLDHKEPDARKQLTEAIQESLLSQIS
jgi:hypothetical protein